VTSASALPCQYVATLVAGRVRETVASAVTERTTRSDRVATWRGTEASAECSATGPWPVRPTAKTRISSKRRSTGSSTGTRWTRHVSVDFAAEVGYQAGTTLVGELTGPHRRFRLVADLPAAEIATPDLLSQPAAKALRMVRSCVLIQRRGHWKTPYVRAAVLRTDAALGRLGRCLIYDRQGFGRSERPEPFVTSEQLTEAIPIRSSWTSSPVCCTGATDERSSSTRREDAQGLRISARPFDAMTAS
jgi:hypothetical protein